MIFQDPGKALNRHPRSRHIAEVFYQHRSEEPCALSAGGATHSHSCMPSRSRRAIERLISNSPLSLQAEKLEDKVDELVAHALGEVQIANPRKIMNSYRMSCPVA